MSFGNKNKGNFGTRGNHKNPRAGMGMSLNDPKVTAKLPATKGTHNSKAANSNVPLGQIASKMKQGANGMNTFGGNPCSSKKPL